MEAFKQLDAVAMPLPQINVDTDQLVPARYLQKPRSDNFGNYLFRDLRWRADGSENAEFPLNRAEWRNAKIIVAARNFGCGSSREHAVWALIAPSFADIFYNNCFKNGVLPIALTEQQVEELFRRHAAADKYLLTVDLEQNRIYDNTGFSASFEVEPFRRHCLLHGLDDIGLTLEHEAKITAYESAHPAL